MNWNTAIPKTDGFGWANKHFTTDNRGGICAGFSQTWLTLSIIQGKPVTNAGILGNPGSIAPIHRGTAVPGRGNVQRHVHLGGASMTTLPESGLAIQPGYPKRPAWTGWRQIFDALAREPAGYYYMTMKKPYAHAMACIITASKVFYLEPEKGLFEFAKTKFGEGAALFYEQYPFVRGNAYSFYRVDQR